MQSFAVLRHLPVHRELQSSSWYEASVKALSSLVGVLSSLEAVIGADLLCDCHAWTNASRVTLDSAFFSSVNLTLTLRMADAIGGPDEAAKLWRVNRTIHELVRDRVCLADFIQVLKLTTKFTRDSKFLTKKLKWTLHRSSKPTQAVVDPWSKYPPDLRRPRTLIDGSPAETCSTSSQTTVETFKNTFSCFSLKKRALV